MSTKAIFRTLVLICSALFFLSTVFEFLFIKNKMKQLVLIMAMAFLACNNSGNPTEEKKDSLDSLAKETKERIDSAADVARDRVDSLEELGKENVDSTIKVKKEQVDSATGDRK